LSSSSRLRAIRTGVVGFQFANALGDRLGFEFREISSRTASSTFLSAKIESVRSAHALDAS